MYSDMQALDVEPSGLPVLLGSMPSNYIEPTARSPCHQGETGCGLFALFQQCHILRGAVYIVGRSQKASSWRSTQEPGSACTCAGEPYHPHSNSLLLLWHEVLLTSIYTRA